MLFFKPAITISSCFLIASCTTNIDQYQSQSNHFDLKNYFNGNLIAWGVIQNRSDKVTRRFCVELNGNWQEDKGILAEKFYFDDGEISYRNWHLIKHKNGEYSGTAEDVVGAATGKHKGFAFNLQYTLNLKIDETSYDVTMDDWMFQIDDYRVVNKTSISKLGFNVANVTLFFDKQLPLNTCQI